MNRLVAIALWASCGCAIGVEASVDPIHLFLAGPGDDGVLARESRHPAGVREYDVIPNVVGLAENALRDLPSAVLVAHDESGELLELHQRRFEPVEGFTIDRQGNVVLDAEVGLEGLSFFWTGAGPRGSASISVRRGRISARILVDNTTYMAVTGPERQSVLQELAGSRLGSEMNYASSVESSGIDIGALPPVAKYIDHVRVLVVHTAQAEAQAILEGTNHCGSRKRGRASDERSIDRK